MRISGQSKFTPLVHYTYDAFGNIATVTTRSASGTTRETSYTYDKLNRVTKIVYPYDSYEEQFIGSEEFTYDAQGRMVLKKDGNDDLTAYQYDALGRLLGVDYEYSEEFSADVTYGYEELEYASGDFIDLGGSLKTSMEDSTGKSLYMYDVPVFRELSE